MFAGHIDCGRFHRVGFGFTGLPCAEPIWFAGVVGHFGFAESGAGNGTRAGFAHAHRAGGIGFCGGVGNPTQHGANRGLGDDGSEQPWLSCRASTHRGSDCFSNSGGAFCHLGNLGRKPFGLGPARRGFGCLLVCCAPSGRGEGFDGMLQQGGDVRAFIDEHLRFSGISCRQEWIRRWGASRERMHDAGSGSFEHRCARDGLHH